MILKHIKLTSFRQKLSNNLHEREYYYIWNKLELREAKDARTIFILVDKIQNNILDLSSMCLQTACMEKNFKIDINRH